ncbi:MAG: hypothetical protein Kow0099_13150 [Candidatus Abyssubacteria bacterium]
MATAGCHAQQCAIKRNAPSAATCRPRPGAVPQAFFSYVGGKKKKGKKRKGEKEVEAHRDVIPSAATCKMAAATRCRNTSGFWYLARVLV